jgi:hypothetical protein
MILSIDNIPTHFQEATPLKKKLDEFGTFLAKVADHGFLTHMNSFSFQNQGEILSENYD